MTLNAFILIACSAIFHASWNLLSKSNRPSLVFYMQASMTAAILWSFFIVWGITKIDWSIVPSIFYLMFLGSLICEVTYFTGLANAYKRADISMAYPMARALPVLFTGLITMTLGIGKPLNIFCISGLILIFCGCFIMPLQSFKQLQWKTYLNKNFIFIVLAACGTTGYTIFDSQAIKFLKTAFDPSDKALISCMYLGMMELSIASSIFILSKFIPSEREEFTRCFCRSWIPSCSGIFSTLAYVMILMAMPLVTNVSFVQAFRQVSLPLCALAGVVLLHEKMTVPRFTGLILIFSGLVLSVF